MVDKHQAVIDYIINCPNIRNSPLYFNFINAQDDTNQFVTNSNDRYTNTRYIDGSIGKLYTFTIITFKSINDNAVVKLPDYPNENILDLTDIQALINWIIEQDELQNFPDFGEDCIVESIATTTDEPSFDGIDEQTEPNLAVYSVTIEISYIDISKRLWR
jgi:hypothetical protein